MVDAESNGWREGWAGPELWLGRDATPTSAGSAVANAGGRRSGRPVAGQDQQPGRTQAECAGDPVANTGSPELEGQQPGQRDPRRWQKPDGYPALPGGTGLHPPGPGDHAAWAAALASRPDLAPAVGFDDCIAWACRIAQGLESPGAAAAEPSVPPSCDGQSHRGLVDGLAHRSRAQHPRQRTSRVHSNPWRSPARTLWQQRMRGALSRLPMASGPWIWRSMDGSEAPEQMNLFEGLQP